MKIGEVSLNTNDVRRLADFYRKLFGIESDSEDEIHQVLISEETQLTVYNDGTYKNNCNTNVSLAFTVNDIDLEYQKLLALGVNILEKPTLRPWGTINLSFCDPDNNVIYFRCFPKQ